MNKYYLLKVDTNKRVNNEAYFDLLSEKYIELTEKELKEIYLEYAKKLFLDYPNVKLINKICGKIRKVLKND